MARLAVTSVAVDWLIEQSRKHTSWDHRSCLAHVGRQLLSKHHSDYRHSLASLTKLTIVCESPRNNEQSLIYFIDCALSRIQAIKNASA